MGTVGATLCPRAGGTRQTHCRESYGKKFSDRVTSTPPKEPQEATRATATREDEMANERTETASTSRSAAQTQVPRPAAGGSPVGVQTIRWDDSNLKSSYANVCNVSSTREEVVLVF